MKLSDIISKNDLRTSTIFEDIDINNCSTNPETEKEGCIFVSLHSDRDKEKRAIERGCAVILCEGDERSYTVPVLYAQNIRFAYASLCECLSGFDNQKIKLIGVTGTNGKTSVAKIIYGIINKLGHKCGFIGTGKIELPERVISGKFYSMTTPDPNVLYPALKEMCDDGCEYAVMEISSHSLFYEKVSPLHLELSVFTNLSAEHLDFHKNLEEYYQAKKRITDISEALVINMDDAYGRRLYTECNGQKIGVGILYDADVQIKGIDANDFSGTEYLYYGDGFVFITKTQLIGLFNVYNTALALTAVIKLGFKPYLAKRALASIKSIRGRFDIISKHPTVIIDYAHTPAGMESFIKSLKSTATGRKITVVFGAGGDRDKEKRPKMAEIAENLADKIVVTTDNPRGEEEGIIIKNIVSGFSENAEYTVIPNRAEAISYAIECAQDGDVIAIVGKGCEEYIIDKNGYHSFSDSECVLNSIKRKNEKRKNEN